LLRYRELIKQLVRRDLKIRYKNSVLGFFWSLLNPLIQVATITIVVKYILGLEIANYSAYLLAAYLPWAFFQMALLDSSQILISHRDLLRKVYFPREALPLSAVLSNLVHFVLALVVFFAYIIFYIQLILHGSGILITALWLPVLILLQTLLLIGLSCIVSCLNVFYEDTKYILAVLLNVFFYLTPVMYPAELIRSWLQKWNIPELYKPIIYKAYMILPMNALTDAYRKTLLPVTNLKLRGVEVEAQPLDYAVLVVAGIICVLIALGGYAFFNSRKWIFAERV
ncbi:MAG: ABC transporter permease, partial [Armatimonadota bacterium]|nr:ABC transporter permease [Armatimonadota bacterium]